MFVIIFVIGILTAFAQIVSSFYDLKKPNPQIQGIKKITAYGWFFYVCTIILAVLPAIQKELQEDIEEKKDRLNLVLQDQRDEILRKRYDSSLIAMKEKYDTTAIIISETLGKYGYKLDLTNKVLVSIKDSAKVRIFETSTPVLQLAMLPIKKGIEFLGIQPDGKYKFSVSIHSRDAGSTDFNIRHSFLSSDTVTESYLPCIDTDILDKEQKFAKDDVNVSYHYLSLRPTDLLLFLWLRGAYKKDDHSGNFTINDVYLYNIKNQTVTIVKGETKKNVIRLIEAIGK